MAIAASKLGQLIAKEWSAEDSLIRSLRDKGLVRPDIPDILLVATVQQAREEHEAIPEGQRAFNSPNERVRVFLDPYLTKKGRRWAVPIDSLALADDESMNHAAWWQFWR